MIALARSWNSDNHQGQRIQTVILNTHAQAPQNTLKLSLWELLDLIMDVFLVFFGHVTILVKQTLQKCIPATLMLHP